jgi:hypothetical protein
VPHLYKLTSKGQKTRYVHRVIAEAAIGRALQGKEVVHHRDGDRYNNDPSNLEVIESHSLHMQLEHFQRRYAGQEELLPLDADGLETST